MSGTPTPKRTPARPTTEASGGGRPPRGRVTHEVGADDESYDPNFVSVAIPPVLAKEFVIERELGEGGQAAVILSHRTGDPADRVALKIYRTTASLSKDDPRDVIRGIPAEYAVQYVAPFFGAFNGRWWEVLEYLPEGSVQDLADEQGGTLTREQVEQVLASVTEALDHAHSLSPRLVHRDIKPANLLIRSRDPLRVVLADFGLARFNDVSHERHSNSGSSGYTSPQGMAGKTDPPVDWWSLGMTLAELVLGQHPYALADGRIYNDAAIADALRDGPVPLTGLDDARLELLLRGLLTYDAAKRWRAPQVRAWLAGESPEVTEHRAAAAPRTRVEAFSFLKRTFDDPADLGNAILQNWNEVGDKMAGRDLDRIEQWIDTVAPELSITAYADRFRAGRMRVSALLAAVAVRLDPDAEPLFAGERVDLKSLAGWGERVAGGDDALAGVMAELYLSGALQDSYWRLPGQSRLGVVHEAWEDLVKGAEDWFRKVPQAGTLTPDVRAVLLRTAVERALAEA